jgi:transposase
MILGITNVIYVDECGINQYYQRGYGRAPVGIRVESVKSGKKLRRTNVIAALWGKKHIAVQCYNHTTNARFFEDWFEFELLAVIPHGSLIIMDNASFHRKKSLYKIAQRYGVHVLFLPPYSPDYNPIEKSWANLKRWLCDNLKRWPCIDIAVDCYFYT